jgi:hypothetical protein
MFGGSVLLDQFPAARLEALPAVVRQMRRYLAPDALQLWRQRFPGEIPPHPAATRGVPRDDLPVPGPDVSRCAVGIGERTHAMRQ